LLGKFLPALLQHTRNELAEIYVADNNSTDDSVAFLKHNFPQVKIIQLAENKGYAGGYNEALKKVSEPVYVLVNSDIEVTPNWLEPLLETMYRQENIAAVQPKILDWKNKEKFEYAGAAGGFIDKYGYPFCRGRIFDVIEKDEGQYNDITPVFWASGACFAVRRDAFWETGGFDENFFAHMEEIDLCWRLFHLQKTVWFDYRSVVYHVGGKTLSQDNPFKTYLNFRNSLYMLYKNLSANRWRIIFTRLVLDGIAGIRFLLQGEWRFVAAVLKAHFHFYMRFSKLKRPQTTNPEKYYLVNSIVYQFFVRKKHSFSELHKTR
jgi:hypothetical protein